MPRRASSKTHPVWLVVAFLILAGALAGGIALWHTVSDPYRTLTPLDVSAYMDNADSLRGNVYKIDGTIDNALAWSPADGRLFSVDADDSGGAVVPLLVPAQFNEINVQKGQRFSFKVKVGDKGVLMAEDMRKL